MNPTLELEVLAECERQEKSTGQTPVANKVLAAIGHGSKTDVCRLVRQYIERSATCVPPELQSMMNAVLERAWSGGENALRPSVDALEKLAEQNRRNFENRIKYFEADICTLRDEKAALQDELASMHLELNSARALPEKLIDAHKADIAARTKELHYCRMQCDALREKNEALTREQGILSGQLKMVANWATNSAQPGDPDN